MKALKRILVFLTATVLLLSLVSCGDKSAAIKKEFEKDGWTVRTEDGGLSAQWEHTLGITEDGVIIFTEKMTHD